MDLRGSIFQVEATVKKDLTVSSSSSSSVATSSSTQDVTAISSPSSSSVVDFTSTCIELAAPGQEVYDIIIRQPMETSGIFAILEQCKWSDDPEQIDRQRMAWLRKGASNVLASV